ncbi:MAG: hypothetical protein JWQ30_1327 [Sediminibacterium sp.]|nr:hypothetical protein [Sediminibacterium sp.]
MTGVSYVTNQKGKATAVLVSLKKWDEMQQSLEKLRILEDLKNSFKQMEQHAKGKLTTPTTSQLLAQL